MNTTANSSPDVQPRFGSPEWVADFASRYGIPPMAGAEAPAGAPPAAAAGDPAPPGDGQGAGDAGAKGAGGFNWGMFPDVPEEQRALLEPHLRDVQAHVTRLEQAHAPYKDLELPQGVDPQELPVLLNFNDQLNKDPVGTWLALAENMQKNGVLPEDLDLEAVAAAANGQEYEGGGEPTEGGEPVEGESPEIAELRAQVEAEREARIAGETERQERIQNQLFQNALGKMRTALTEAGVNEETMPDDRLLASAIITNQGDVEAATQMLLGFRDSQIKGFTQGKTKGPSEEVTMPKGAPKAPKRETGKGHRAQMREASQGAVQMLKRRNEEAGS